MEDDTRAVPIAPLESEEKPVIMTDPAQAVTEASMPKRGRGRPKGKRKEPASEKQKAHLSRARLAKTKKKMKTKVLPRMMKQAEALIDTGFALDETTLLRLMMPHDPNPLTPAQQEADKGVPDKTDSEQVQTNHSERYHPTSDKSLDSIVATLTRQSNNALHSDSNKLQSSLRLF